MDNKSNNFSFLTKEQVSRDKGIDIIKKRGHFYENTKG